MKLQISSPSLLENKVSFSHFEFPESWMPPKKKTKRGLHLILNGITRKITRNVAGMTREQRNQYNRVMRKPKEDRLIH